MDTQKVERLEVAQCWNLLRRNDLGRLALGDGDGDGVDIFPVNYLVFDDDLYFRSAPGSKLAELTAHPSIAFEVDGRAGGRVWSVVVHGVATRLSADDDIIRSGIDRLRTTHPTVKHNYVMIRPESVTGREFFGARRRWSLRALVAAGVLVVVVIAAVGAAGQALGW